MSTEELSALAALTFNWTQALDDVWTDLSYHVDGLHAETANLIRAGIGEASADSSRPIGIVIQGERGVGKTHLLGWTREQVQLAGGYFFLVGDLFTKAFWEQVLGSVVEQLLPFPDGRRHQLQTVLTGLADRGPAPDRPEDRTDLPGHGAGAGPAGVAPAGGSGRRLLLPDRLRGRPRGP